MQCRKRNGLVNVGFATCPSYSPVHICTVSPSKNRLEWADGILNVAERGSNWLWAVKKHHKAFGTGQF